MQSIIHTKSFKKSLAIGLLSLSLLPFQANAQISEGFELPATITSQDLTPRGSADFHQFFIKALTIKLWTQSPNSTDVPYVMQTEYAYEIKDKYLVEAALRGMLKHGIPRPRVGRWFKYLRQITPTVKKGDVITAVRTAESTSFYLNGQFIGEINEAQFGEDFFGVWLDDNTQYPKIRAKLLQQ